MANWGFLEVIHGGKLVTTFKVSKKKSQAVLAVDLLSKQSTSCSKKFQDDITNPFAALIRSQLENCLLSYVLFCLLGKWWDI